MSGLEALGAVAAASQLASQGMSLLLSTYELYSKFRNAPQSIQDQSVQISQLIDIFQAIQSSSSLGTPEITTLVDQCMRETTKLQGVLKKVSQGGRDKMIVKAWRSVKAIGKEKQILDILSSLERQKTALVLLINSTDANVLQQIHVEVAQVQTSVNDTYVAVNTVSASLNGVSANVEKISANVESVCPAVVDTNRKVTTLIDTSSTISTGLTEVSQSLPQIAGQLEVVHDSIPSVKHSIQDTNIKITTVHEELPRVAGAMAEISEQKLPLIQESLQRIELNQSVSIPPSAGARNPSNPLWIMPFNRNYNFIGRESFTKDLEVTFESNNHSRVAIFGLGGIGKTQIAIEYVYRYHESHPTAAILWIHASTVPRFEQDYVEIGKQAHLPGINDSARDVKLLVKNWLASQESGTWLMVVDNADDADVFFSAGKTRLADYLPQCPNGKILFTTRNKRIGINFATACNIIDLPKMQYLEAEELFLARSGKQGIDSNQLLKLVELLEYHPLAISQAASYVAENSILVSEYLDMYNNSEETTIELLSEDFEDPARDLDSKNPVATTLLISIDQIQRWNSLATDLLSFMAFLDRQGIPKDLLPLSENRVEHTKALGLLKAYSLITPSNDGRILSVHRLVHIAVRNWLRMNGEFHLWAESSLERVAEQFPDPRAAQNWDACESYFPHTEAVLHRGNASAQGHDSGNIIFPEHAYCDAGTLPKELSCLLEGRLNWSLVDLASITSVNLHDSDAHETRHLWDECQLCSYCAAVSRLSCKLSTYYSDHGNYKAAIVSGLRAVILGKSILGPNDPLTLRGMGSLARALEKTGKYDAAELIQTHVLKESELALGYNHLETMYSAFNLATVFWRLDKIQEAELLHRRVVEGREQKLGPDHPETLTSINDLALCLKALGRIEEAESMYRRALKVHEQHLGPVHPEALTASHNLAFLLGDIGQYEEAKTLYLRTLAGREEALGPDHPDTSLIAKCLAFIYEKQGNYMEAERLHRRAFERYEKVLGFEHKDTLDSVYWLARVLEKNRNYEEAEILYRRVIKGYERLNHQPVNSLALLFDKQGKFQEAEELNRKSSEEHEKKGGQFHKDMLIAIYDLADLLENQGHLEEAEPLYRRAIDESPEPDHEVMNLLAMVLEKQKKPEEAEDLYRRSLKEKEQVLGNEHKDTLTVVYNLADLLENQGCLEEAEVLYRRAIDESQEPNHSAMNHLAILLDNQGKPEEAEDLYRRSLQIKEQVLGNEHKDTLTVVYNLAGFLENQGRLDEAEILIRRAADGYEKMLGPEDPETVECVEILANILEKQNAAESEDLESESTDSVCADQD